MTNATNNTDRVNNLCIDCDFSDHFMNLLLRAADLGADDVTLRRLIYAVIVSDEPTCVLPREAVENLSGGKGWARQGHGDDAVWGERCAEGHRVATAGQWTVGAVAPGRKSRESWTVEHVAVGSETWTIAN